MKHMIFLSYFFPQKNDIETVTKCFSSGGGDYICKPFAKEELIARVKTQLLLKKKEERLKRVNNGLEVLVEERTRELEAGKRKLEDYNTALSVLLEKRVTEQDELAKRIDINARELVFPLLENLKDPDIDYKQRQKMVKACIDNIKKLISPFVSNLQNKITNMGFTPKELTICNLISSGKSTQEISLILNSSESTVSYHRNNIREKLGLKNKNQNLQIHLKQLGNYN